MFPIYKIASPEGLPAGVKAHNFFFLLQRMSEIPSGPLSQIYMKNLTLLKENIKILTFCPSLLQIQGIFLDSYVTSKKSACNKTTHLFSKGKTLFVWLLSVYELFTGHFEEKFKNDVWEWISKFLPESDPISLKCKWFRYSKQSGYQYAWTPEQDQTLLQIMRNYYPILFDPNISCAQNKELKIKWAKVSYELNKMIVSAQDFKKDCHCRERWLNHLSPSINKKEWTLDEDITLLQQSVEKPKKWAKISEAFPGRNQHKIKNRFISLINKENGLNWKETKKIMKSSNLNSCITKALEALISQKNEAVSLYDQKEKSKKNELKCEKNEEKYKEKNEENEENSLGDKDDIKNEFFLREIFVEQENFESNPCFFWGLGRLY